MASNWSHVHLWSRNWGGININSPHGLRTEEDGSKKAVLVSQPEEGTLGVHYRADAHEKKEMPLFSSDWSRGGTDWCQSGQF